MGISDKSTQKSIPQKGNKKDLKKPLQVLHISKKHTPKNYPEIQDEKTNLQKEIKNENIAIKPQIIKDKSVKEIEENYENTKAFEGSQQDLNRPFNFSEQNKDFQLERTVDEFDFDESAFLEALNANEPIGTTGETISGRL